MRILPLFIFVAIATTQLIFSQSIENTQNTQLLFKVANEEVSVDEFTRVYLKNLDLISDESQKDVQDYLNLYIDYKIKLAEAKRLGYNQKESYLRELQSYKNQLTESFIYDSEINDALVKEAYNRSLEEVKAQHILIKLDPTQSDTTAVYQKLLEFKSMLQDKGFESIKSALHDGQRIFVEDLGYFSAFKLVYEFESKAYQTEVGEISDPFRTRFGYHILKVLDRRPSMGEVTVSHIMVGHKPKDTLNSSEKRIQEIYNLLQQGERFESLAKSFSEDKNSAAKGGKLKPFRSGQINSIPFETAAFALPNPGAISKPVKTNFGWHILKLMEKKSNPTFQNAKMDFENKVKKDTRSKLIKDKMYTRLLGKYKVNYLTSNLVYFKNKMSVTDYFSGKWEKPKDFPKDSLFMEIEQKRISYDDFANFLIRTQRDYNPKWDIDALLSNKYGAFLEYNIFKYRRDNLENENPEYAYLLKEYKEGLLLFDLMQDKIWEGAKQDSIGLSNYFKQNSKSYFWPRQIDASVARSSSKVVLKEVKKLLKSGLSTETIAKKLNNQTQKVIFTNGLMSSGDIALQSFPDEFVFKKGISKIFKLSDAYSLVFVKSTIPERPKTLEESKGQLISDYQLYIENKWMHQLRTEYPVYVNDAVLENIKLKLAEN